MAPWATGIATCLLVGAGSPARGLPDPPAPDPAGLNCPPGWVKSVGVRAHETAAYGSDVRTRHPFNYYRGMYFPMLDGPHPHNRWWYNVRLPGGVPGTLPAWDTTYGCVPPQWLTGSFPDTFTRGQTAMITALHAQVRTEPGNRRPAWTDRSRLGYMQQGTVLRVIQRMNNGWLAVRPTSFAATPQWYMQPTDLVPIELDAPTSLMDATFGKDADGLPTFTMEATRPLPVLFTEDGPRVYLHAYADSISRRVKAVVNSAQGKLRIGEVVFPVVWPKAPFGYTGKWEWTTDKKSAIYTFRAKAPPPPPPGGWLNSLQGLRVVLDPGHGAGFDLPGWKEGGRAKHGGVWYREETFNLAMGLATRDELTRRGATVFMTRR